MGILALNLPRPCSCGNLMNQGFSLASLKMRTTEIHGIMETSVLKALQL